MQSVSDDEVGLFQPLLAEAQFIFCGISALFSWARNCINQPDLSHLKAQANAGGLLAEEPDLPLRIIRISGRKTIRCVKAALSSKQG